MDWISDFLTNKQQRVYFNGNYSGWGKVTSDILQGSVHGPILLVNCINDLPVTVKKTPHPYTCLLTTQTFIKT